MASEEPSPDTIQRRVRNRIIEYLELVCDKSTQLRLQAEVPYVSMVNELINMWEDWVPYHPKGHYAGNVFSAEEEDSMIRYHSIWDSVAERIVLVSSLDEFVEMEEYDELTEAAERTLSVFMKRGKMSED